MKVDKKNTLRTHSLFFCFWFEKSKYYPAMLAAINEVFAGKKSFKCFHFYVAHVVN